MSGGDPKLAIHEVVPQITDQEIDGALTAIFTQPQREWRMFAAMLGLDGAQVVIHRGQKKGRFA